jgi:hypothetical protein
LRCLSRSTFKPGAQATSSALLAIVGYAIGTAQVLFIDWVQRRREHVRQLRLLRAEFRRAYEFRSKFSWHKGEAPESDAIPYLPRLSDQYVSTVTSIDYYLTDEHDDDNAQQAHLNILDGIAHLNTYHTAALSLVEQAKAASDRAVALELLDRAFDNATIYDKEVDRVCYIIGSALEDIDRRMNVARLGKQLRRVGRKLPKRENPSSLTRHDPRLGG